MLGLRSLRSLQPRRGNQYWVGFVKISAAFGGLDTELGSGGAATRRAALWTYVHVGAERNQKYLVRDLHINFRPLQFCLQLAQLHPRMPMEIDELQHVMETTINGLSILFNCFLLYLIKYHSTFGEKMYKYLLTVDASLDLILSLVTLFAQPVALNCNGASKRVNILIISITVVYSLIALAVNYLVMKWREDFQPTGQLIMETIEWPKHANGKMVYFGGQFSAICPLITSTGPIYYYSASFIFQLCPGKFSAIMSSAVSWITFFNPLTTILCFRCYRQTTLRFIACGSIKPTINPSSLPVNPTSNYVI
ncbi:hypothetical protein DdX_17099 [Ditylenchus destructor]|uniref:Uncharacterized protein n=1 Tax=Ditylenchus destructor TaxID=166010 RepID=A0AAD4MMA7_9BILA|nr:hypothetical protein DdX_17099 [Ditylenchus destructor]